MASRKSKKNITSLPGHQIIITGLGSSKDGKVRVKEQVVPRMEENAADNKNVRRVLRR